MAARTKKWQPPPAIVTIIAGIGVLAGIILGWTDGYTGALLIGALILFVLAIVEPFSALLILLVSAPLKALIQAEAPIAIPTDIGQLGFVLLLVSLLLHHAIHSKPVRLELSSTHFWLVLLLLASMLSLPSAPSISSGITELLKWFEMAVLISVCLLLARCARR